MIPLPDKKYSIIYADPPWGYQNRGHPGGRLEALRHHDRRGAQENGRRSCGGYC